MQSAGCSSPAPSALPIVLRRRPQVVVTVGGYAAVPCSLAAIVLRVPLVVVSCDAIAGASNRLVARFARKSAVAFPGTSLPAPGRDGRAAPPGGPRPHNAPRRDARRPAPTVSVPAGRFLLAVEGGSLGARRLNDAALGLAQSWAARDDVSIYHVAGERNFAAVKSAADSLGLGPQPQPGSGLDYRLVGYESQMPALLAACDFAVCRAGALTVAELAAIGTPSALVPLPGAPNDHQTRNAEALTWVGAAILISDDECTAEHLEEIVTRLHRGPGTSRGHELSGVGRRSPGLGRSAWPTLVESVSKEGS